MQTVIFILLFWIRVLEILIMTFIVLISIFVRNPKKRWELELVPII